LTVSAKLSSAVALARASALAAAYGGRAFCADSLLGFRVRV
jgi:hypothetical protein